MPSDPSLCHSHTECRAVLHRESDNIMAFYLEYLAFICWAVIIQASGASIQRNDRPDAALLTLPSNSKFFNPQLDDETNLQLIDGEYDDETNATQTEDLVGEDLRNEVNSTPKEVSTPKPVKTKSKSEEKFFGFGLLDFLKPVFGYNAGLGYGGLYGSQYYGLNGPGGISRPGGTWGFPFYNYPYYNGPRTSGKETADEKKA